MMTSNKYTLAELQRIPTIRQGYTDDLKVETGKVRVWLSRMTVEDGMDYDNAVTVERYVDGSWVEEDVYPAGDKS